MVKKNLKVRKVIKEDNSFNKCCGHTHEHISAAALFLVFCFLAIVVILAITTINGV
jgi:hypothetical protein